MVLYLPGRPRLAAPSSLRRGFRGVVSLDRSVLRPLAGRACC